MNVLWSRLASALGSFCYARSYGSLEFCLKVFVVMLLITAKLFYVTNVRL